MADLKAVLLRDIDSIAREVELYPDDATLWRKLPGIPNSGGNLALHLVGNLRHFIGKLLGGSAFVRDRESEFSDASRSREEILRMIAVMKSEVTAALDALTEERLEERIELPAVGGSLPIRRMLLHLSAHLSFHTGQLDYHRRLVTGDRTGAGTVRFDALL